MEIPTPFDLNDAIHRWRENLAGSPAFRAENLDELEAHLRDSVSALAAKGLSDEEAWWVAMRRVGCHEDLHQEYQKLNRKGIWLERAVWIVVGSQLLGILGYASSIAANLTICAGILADLRGHALGLVGLIAGPAFIFLLLWRGWRYTRVRANWWSCFEPWVRNHPLRLLVGMAMSWLLFSVISFSTGIAANAVTNRLMSPIELTEYFGLFGWRLLSGLIGALVVPSLLAWLIWHRSRKTQRPPA